MKKLDGTPMMIKLVSKLSKDKCFIQTALENIISQIHSNEVLKVNKEKYENIFRNSLVAIYTIDIKTMKVIEVNDKSIELFGYKSEQDYLDHFINENHFVNQEGFSNIQKTLWILIVL